MELYMNVAWLFEKQFEQEKKRKIMQAVEKLSTSIKEKGVPRAPCIPFTKRNKRKKSMGIRRVTNSSLCLILVTRVERTPRSLLKSASGAREFISLLDGTGMKLHSNSISFYASAKLPP
eukprot:1151385-Pelagomonas_calceolata.AAC.1